MDSIVEAKVRRYLMDRFYVDPTECGVITRKIKSLARRAGFGLDERFATSGMAAGPEASVASNIVARAMGKSGDSTAEKDIRVAIERWTRTSAPTGLI